MSFKCPSVCLSICTLFDLQCCIRIIIFTEARVWFLPGGSVLESSEMFTLTVVLEREISSPVSVNITDENGMPWDLYAFKIMRKMLYTSMGDYYWFVCVLPMLSNQTVMITCGGHSLSYVIALLH